MTSGLAKGFVLDSIRGCIQDSAQPNPVVWDRATCKNSQQFKAGETKYQELKILLVSALDLVVSIRLQKTVFGQIFPHFLRARSLVVSDLPSPAVL